MPKKASDVMKSPVVTINQNQTIYEAIELISKCSFSGLLVTDSEGILVGILSETDILKYSQKDSIVPLISLSGWISPHTEISDIAAVRKGADLLKSTPVKKVMTKKVISVDKNSSVYDAAQIMNKKNINRLPVVDDEGLVVGIITRSDMVRAIAAGL